MAIQVRRATRKKAKLRLGISAPAGGGKTMGALLVAYGITGDWDKIGLADTENGSGELYAGQRVPGTTLVIGEYPYARIDAPYTISKYIEAQKALEEAGCEVVILDSTSHAWAGAGGLLDKQGKIADKSGNGYTAWRTVTPEHNLFVDTMLSSPVHIIATIRSKTEYVMEKDGKGETKIRKVGLAPVQRDGMDFEFSIMMDIDQNHMATATKDRTSLFDGEYFKLSPEIGKRMRDWLETGAETPAPPNLDDELVARIKAALAKAQDHATIGKILGHPDAKRLHERIHDDAQAAADRLRPADNTDWTTGSEEAA